MRAYIPHMDTQSMPWKSSRPGTSAKLLSLNESKPASTVLLCFDPDEGYQDQPSPHYHDGLEELLILSGRLSFDRRTWFHRGGYVFHPPQVIHGFDSCIPTKTTLLARTEGVVQSTFIDGDDALDDFPYFIGETPSTRPLTLVPSPWAFPFAPMESKAGVVRQFIYGQDDDGPALTRLLRFAAGAIELQPRMVTHGTAEEILVLSGRLKDAGGQVFKEGDFACFPAGSQRSPLNALEDAEVLHAVVDD